MGAFAKTHGKHRERLADAELLSGVDPDRATALASQLTPVIEALERLRGQLLRIAEADPESDLAAVPVPSPTRPTPMTRAPVPTPAATRPPATAKAAAPVPVPVPAGARKPAATRTPPQVPVRVPVAAPKAAAVKVPSATRRPAKATAPTPASRPTPARPSLRPAAVSSAGGAAAARLEASALTAYRLVHKLLHTGVAASDLSEVIVRRAGVSRDLARRIALLHELPDPWKRRLEATSASTTKLTLNELLARSGLVFK